MKTSIWHHAPEHRFIPGQTYIVTARTVGKEHFFRSSYRLEKLQGLVLDHVADAGWTLKAWSFFSDHYHWIAYATALALELEELIRNIHSESAILVNELDHVQGRQVWFQYWDTCLTYPASYYARLKYVNTNPVHHGLVEVATQYPFCSAGWWEAKASPATLRRIDSYRCDRISIQDDFAPVWDRLTLHEA